VLRRLNQQLLLPRCVKAWASAAASAAAAWDEKEVGGSRGAAERLVPSPVNILTTQNPSQKGHLAPAQSLRSSLVKGQVTDSHAGWFSGGSVSPPTEAAGATPRVCLPSFLLLVPMPSLAVFTLKPSALQAQTSASRRTPPVTSITHANPGQYLKTASKRNIVTLPQFVRPPVGQRAIRHLLLLWRRRLVLYTSIFEPQLISHAPF
jgi:hypothetical protein